MPLGSADALASVSLPLRSAELRAAEDSLSASESSSDSEVVAEGVSDSSAEVAGAGALVFSAAVVASLAGAGSGEGTSSFPHAVSRQPVASTAEAAAVKRDVKRTRDSSINCVPSPES